MKDSEKCDTTKDGDEEEEQSEFTGTNCGALKLVACFFSFCVIGGLVYGNGIIHSALLDRYGASIGVTSWAGALMGSLMLAAGRVLHKFQACLYSIKQLEYREC